MVLLYRHLHLAKYTGFFEDGQCMGGHFPNQILLQALLFKYIFVEYVG
jgi:hypothetical protein